MTTPSKVNVNSLSERQLNDIIIYCLNNNIASGPRVGLKMLQRVGNGTEIYPHGQVIYFTNFSSSPYPRIHVPDVLWNSWVIKPKTRDYLSLSFGLLEVDKLVVNFVI